MYQMILYSFPKIFIKKTLILFFVSLIYCWNSQAQNLFPEPGEVFNDDVIPRIDIHIDPDSLDVLYAPGNETSYHHFLATFVFDNGNILDTLDNVGFRFRGNTSRFSAKKSFKVSFNTFESGRQWYGLEKLNINGEHNDPSVARSKICWDYCRQMGIPAPRANHVELYINDQYWGLYINVEHIDEEFVDLRFGNKDGNLFKCLYPADLAYKGDDPDLYKQFTNGRRTYDLRTNEEIDDYADLAEFIDIINNTPAASLPCELEPIFNVDTYLKAIAMDIFTANWDGPIYNKNNFYLYKNTSTGKFEYIPYDLDNTFGIDWFGKNWAERNIYTWSKTGATRPIYNSILAVPEYRARYSYYTAQILQHIYHPGIWNAYLDDLKERISSSAENDPIRPLDYGFSYDDFLNSFEEGLPWGHTPVGIREFMDQRRNASLNQLELENISPVIQNFSNNYPNENQILKIRTQVFDDEAINEVQLCYFEDGQGPNCIPMFDDGNNDDEAANDGIYGIALPAFNKKTTIEYYIMATDNTGKNTRNPICQTQKIYIGSSDVQLVINEFMASNNTTIADEFGEYDDWIEIINPSNEVIYVGNYFLSDNPDNPDKWQLPPVSMTPNSYLVIWADKDENQGERHANFKLSASGEFVGIFDTQDSNFGLIDGYGFSEMQPDEAIGRLPNGTGDFQPTFPTPFATNEPVNTSEIIDNQKIKLTTSPNPFTEDLTISIENPEHQYLKILIHDILGRPMFESTFGDDFLKIPLKTDSYSNGVYYLNVVLENGESIVHQIIKI
jgi:hypothetical protein